MKASLLRKCFVLATLFFSGCVSMVFSSNLNDSSWRFSAFADLYLGTDLLENKNREIGLSEIVSFHRYREVSINSAILNADYLDSQIRFSMGLGFGDYFIKNMSAEPLGYRNIYQCFGGIRLSAKNNIWLDGGIMPSHIGYESAISSDQATLTRSLVSDFSPYYEAGLKLSAQKNRSVFNFLVLNGWQQVVRKMDEDGLNLGARYNYSSGVFEFNYSGYYGRLGTGNSSNIRLFHDVFSTIKLRNWAKLTVLVDLGQDGMGETAKSWWGTAAVMQFRLNNTASVSGRIESFSDKHRTIINSAPIGSTLQGYSVNFDKKIGSKAIVRLEIKQLSCDKPVFFNSNATLFKDRVQTMLSLAWKI